MSNTLSVTRVFLCLFAYLCLHCTAARRAGRRGRTAPRAGEADAARVRRASAWATSECRPLTPHHTISYFHLLSTTLLLLRARRPPARFPSIGGRRAPRWRRCGPVAAPRPPAGVARAGGGSERASRRPFFSLFPSPFFPLHFPLFLLTESWRALISETGVRDDDDDDDDACRKTKAPRARQ